MATVPGEAIVELGWWIRNDSLKIGFDKTFILGYSNNYLGTFPRSFCPAIWNSLSTSLQLKNLKLFCAPQRQQSLWFISLMVIFLGYITTPREYMVGGYEAMLTLFGIDTAEKIRNAVYFVASKVF